MNYLRFYIVIPAHNEESSVAATLDSLIKQTLQPKHIVVVNDNSSDNTEQIIKNYSNKYPNITSVNINSSNKHLPGRKIINAFNQGLNTLDDNYDVICKFDADLIFPKNYLEQLAIHFNENPKLGMAAGFCYIKENNQWILENLTRKDHIRGALKAYKKFCFEAIGGLKPSIGWDTVDELLAKYFGWTIMVDEDLHVKHLKPTGETYNESSKYLQGEAFYKLDYGILLTSITALKMAYRKKKLSVFYNYIKGYYKAKSEHLDRLVTKDQGKFIRKLRWKGILDKLK